MQFVGMYQIDPKLCDSLIELHRVGERRDLVVRGRLGTADGVVVDTDLKDSYDLGLVTVPDDLAQQYRLPQYYQALKDCVDQYYEGHPVLKDQMAPVHLAESPIIQHYKPGGGYKYPHFERTCLESTTRALVWMTYLNDVTDGGGTRFIYQNETIEARKGRTLIWPSDFTHTHVGVVSPTQHKYIITGWLNFAA